MQSIWNGVKESDHKLSLDKDIKRDIVIVGGGISGLLMGYRLMQSGREATLIEANTLYSGVTHNTTAHLDAMQGYVYSDLIKTSPQKAKLYFQSQLDAIEEYQKIIDTYKIDCDFKRLDSFMFTINDMKKLEEEYNALKEIGADVELVKEKMLNIDIQGAIKLKNQAQFHPIKFLEKLPKEYEIIENTRVLKVDTKNKILYTQKAEIHANIIIIATGFPIIDIPGFYFLKMYKSSSYSIAFKGAKLDAVYQSDLENGLTYRGYDDYVIMGGLDHRTGRLNHKDKFNRLREKAELSFGKELEYTHTWTANDCITADGVPYAGQYSKSRKDIYVMTGYNKWGMTNSMASSKVICDLITQKPNKFIDLFSPQRKKTNPAHCVVNLLSTVKNLVFKPVSFPDRNVDALKPGEGDIVLYEGRKKAVYRDLDNRLYVVEPLCSHLKCQLKFNSETKTWDCPCHGSRFDIYGKIVVSPTTKNLKVHNGKE